MDTGAKQKTRQRCKVQNAEIFNLEAGRMTYMKQCTDTGDQTDREQAEIQKERKNFSNTGGNNTRYKTIWQEYAEVGVTYKTQVKHISNQVKLEQRQEVKLKNGEDKIFKIKQEVYKKNMHIVG